MPVKLLFKLQKLAFCCPESKKGIWGEIGIFSGRGHENNVKAVMEPFQL